jgi:hypothetical protein
LSLFCAFWDGLITDLKAHKRLTTNAPKNGAAALGRSKSARGAARGRQTIVCSCAHLISKFGLAESHVQQSVKTAACAAQPEGRLTAAKPVELRINPLPREPIKFIYMTTVTPICTGAARMKQAQQAGREGRSAFGRKVDIFRDKAWVGPLPIFSFLIEHPEGRYLVDTGDTAENSTPGYLPWWNPFFTKLVEIKVARLEEIGPRLQAIGIDPARDIEAVILTHYHHDHTGGLHHFPHNRIIGPRDGWKISSGMKGRMMG